MRSLSFPNMFSSSSTNVSDDHESTSTNLQLLLNSERGTLFGDPEFGCKLKQELFSQNSYVLQDIVIDDIYSTISAYMPQIDISRDGISLDTDENGLLININCVNATSADVSLYSIKLLDTE